MENLILHGVNQAVRNETEPFLKGIIDECADLHSMHLVGSSVTKDFIQGVSDINSVVFLERIDFDCLDKIASLGKKYRKKKISAPLVITTDYMESSLDSFPLEFLNFKLIHRTVYGPDVLSGVVIDKSNLRIQCEREIKSKLLLLRQAYISALGDTDRLLESISRSLSGFIPLFRGMLYILGKEVPVHAAESARAFEDSFSLKTAVFEKALGMKNRRQKFSRAEVPAFFREFYLTSEQISGIINDLQA